MTIRIDFELNLPQRINLDYTISIPQNYQIDNLQEVHRSTLTSAGPRMQVFSDFNSLRDVWNRIIEFFKSCFHCFGLFSTTRPLEDRDDHLVSRDNEIQRRLDLQMRYSQQQMEQEPVKSFHYLPAPSAGWSAQEEMVGTFPVGICHAQGRRPTMEDEHLATSFQVQIAGRNYPVQLFGVFDGHGGPKAAEFVRDHLKEQLESSLRQFNPNGLTDAGIWRALKITFIRLNQDFKNMYGNHPHSIAHNQGTTATMAMILDNKLWTANVGDARTVLDNNGNPVQLTEDAKPSDEKYKRNIEKRGGQVIPVLGVMRVNGDLAVARAIGDHRLKGAISARPKITVKPLSEIQPESHLILCCDGIYDVARTRDIVSAVHANRFSSAGTLAKNIVYSAFNSGSTDNLSSLVVKIR